MRVARLLVLLRDGVTMIVPVVVAALFAQQLSYHDQRNRVEFMSQLVLDRAELSTQQLAAAFKKLDAFDEGDACSPAAMVLMRQIDLGSSLLQGVGHIANQKLECSSVGEGAVDVGPYDYVSATGTLFRRNRDVGTGGSVPLLLISDANGATGLVHPALIFDLTDSGEKLPAGIVGYSTRENIVSTGPQFDWSGVPLPAGQAAGSLVLAGHLVAWSRSRLGDTFTYAAVPMAAVDDEFAMLSGIFLPIGAVIGLIGLFLVRRLAAAQSSLPALLKGGLKRGEILTVYQPIVELESGRWVGAEVLARWRRPGDEWVSPDVFVPIAERHGLIRKLTRQVIETSCQQLGPFAKTHRDFFISINISSADLRDPEFAPSLAETVDDHGIARGQVHLEITERAEVDSEFEAETIRTLRGMGFAIGIDDFGIGYSNLAYLDLLQIDYLKIDRAFVAGLVRGELGAQIVDHVIDLAIGRGLELIAEGVETEEQRVELLARQVHLGQGWLFAKPMASADLERAYGEQQSPPTPSVPHLADVA